MYKRTCIVRSIKDNKLYEVDVEFKETSICYLIWLSFLEDLLKKGYNFIKFKQPVIKFKDKR